MSTFLPGREIGKLWGLISEPREQLALGQFTTNDAARILHAEKARRQRKTLKSGRPEEDFGLQCRSRQLPPFKPKWRLEKVVQTPRKDGKAIPKVWEFDFCWPQYQVIVEIDGGIWIPGGGAHSHPIDVERNMAKRNDAAFHGFFVYAFTPKQVKSREAVDWTVRYLAQRGWKP